MVNHICEPISPNQLASCRSARALQGGGEAPLTVELRAELEKQLAAIAGQPRPKGKSLKGKKVPPKYRSPSGETWAGRGARPKWMVEALKKGKKMEDCL